MRQNRRGGSVWVSYPLKQGLKLTAPVCNKFASDGLSQLSIKTRIETSLHLILNGWLLFVWVSYPLKQGLKHKDRDPDTPEQAEFESAIH